MSLQRVAVSVPVADPSLDPESFVPMFHDWIRRGAVDGLLIDVARYVHVPDGPGIVLIGHEGDYSLDLAGGRPSLRYTLKRDNEGAPRELVERAFDRLQGAVRAAAAAGVAVREDEVTVTVFDRLHAPNEEASVAALASDLVAAVEARGAGSASDVDRVSGDPRDPLALRITLATAG
jgi:hypothetical protein